MTDTHKTETDKKPDPGQEKIIRALENLRAHHEDAGTAGATIGDITKLIRARTKEMVSGEPIHDTDVHYNALDTQLSEAQKALRQKLKDAETAAMAPGVTVTDLHKRRIEEAKKKVAEAEEARRIAEELRVKNPEKVKKHHDHHDAEASAKFWQELSPLGAPFRFVKGRLWDNLVKGKGKGWNPLTWPSKSVQYVFTSIPEHKIAAVLGAGVGTVIVGFPLGTALGTAAFSTTAKFWKENMKAESDGHGGHGGGHH